MSVFVKTVWSDENNGPITPAVANRWENGIEEALNLAANAGASQELVNRVTALEGSVSDLLYEPVAISNASISPSQEALGGEITAYTVEYSCSKKPSQITLKSGNTTIETIATPTSASGRIAKSGQSITSDLTLTLSAKDERNATVSKTLKIEFMNYVIYGAANEPATLNSAFVNGLASRILSKTRARSITVNATGNKYIWYAIPTRLGTPVFTVGGFEGGFVLAGTIQVANENSYSEEYKVYRSDYAGLGNTTVVVS